MRSGRSSDAHGKLVMRSIRGWKLVRRTLVSDWTSFGALLILVTLVVLIWVIPVVRSEHSDRTSLTGRNEPPLSVLEDGQRAWLGTDPLGRDLVGRLAEGGRISLAVGAATVALSGLIGTGIGLVAGYRGGVFDALLMRLVDIQMAVPTLLLAIFVLYVLGVGFFNLVLVLAISRWPLFARTIRGAVLGLREEQFVEAAESVGSSDARVMVRHLLPALTSTLAILGTLEIGRAILSEAALSFVGLGIQPPQTSWGLLLSQGREYVSSAWWLTILPGVAISCTVLCINLLAQWLQKIADPLRRSADRVELVAAGSEV